MNHLFNFALLSLVLVTFLGCDREKEPVPAYLHITKFSLTTVVSVEGLNTSDITDTKVFANGQEIGTFELPVTIPVIATGDVEITLIPNIRENGSSNYHKSYKPYTSFIKTINLEKLRVDTIKPITTYRKGLEMHFDWMESFEDPGLEIERYGLNNTNDSLIRISTGAPGVNQPFSGSAFCALIDIAPRDSAIDFERSTNRWLEFPNLGTDVYVEMDYKSNVPIQVGVFTLDANNVVSRIPVLFTFATDKWKKIYINLKSETGDLPLSTRIKVFFGVYTEQGSFSHPVVYLDNLKYVYVN